MNRCNLNRYKVAYDWIGLKTVQKNFQTVVSLVLNSLDSNLWKKNKKRRIDVSVILGLIGLTNSFIFSSNNANLFSLVLNIFVRKQIEQKYVYWSDIRFGQKTFHQPKILQRPLDKPICLS